MDGLSELNVVNLCNPALNGIRTASERAFEWHLSGSGGTPQVYENVPVLRYASTPSVSHPGARGSLPAAAALRRLAPLNLIKQQL